jgi:hypothetical protein
MDTEAHTNQPGRKPVGVRYVAGTVYVTLSSDGHFSAPNVLFEFSFSFIKFFNL